MNYADYDFAITHMHDELKRLSQATGHPDFLGTADAASPEFLALMQRHIELVQMFTKLTERMFVHYKMQRPA